MPICLCARSFSGNHSHCNHRADHSGDSGHVCSCTSLCVERAAAEVLLPPSKRAHSLALLQRRTRAAACARIMPNGEKRGDRDMRWTQSSRLMRCVLLAALPCSLGAQVPATDSGKAVQANSVSVVVATQASARRQGAFKANDVSWTCKGTRCSAAAMHSAVMAACQNLAREVGTIESFTVANHDLPAWELQQCNSMMAVAEAARPSVKQTQVLTKPEATPDPASSASRHSKRLITADDFTLRAQPLPDAPHRATASQRTPSTNTSGSPSAIGPFVPVAIRTPPLTLTGTGVAEVSFRFTPVAVRTSQLTLTGMGVAETTYRFTPIVVRTPQLTLTGTGHVE